MSRFFLVFVIHFWVCTSVAQQYPTDERHEKIDKNVTFIPNQGQWSGSFLYKTNLNRGALFFKTNGFRASFLDPNFDLHDFKHQGGAKLMGQLPSVPEKINCFAYEWQLLNANEANEIVGHTKRTDYRNFFKGNDSLNWKSQVPVFNGLTYKNIYQGIHLHFYGWEDNLKYDFEISPGADPEKIEIQISGLTEPLKIYRGNLGIPTPHGMIEELAPVAWQIVDGVKEPVKIKFILLNDSTFGFQLRKYNDQHTLIIDPTVVFSSFTGGTSDNWGFTATYDRGGHLYTGGISFGQGYPTTLGAFQTNFNFVGPQDPSFGFVADVVISKFSPTGDALVYSTFLGGSRSEQPHSMVVDSQDRLLVYGITSSSDFPVSTNAYQSVFAGGNGFLENAVVFENGTDIFISKFNATGSALVGSSYIGGAGNDGFNASLRFNYGDGARGEIQVNEQDEVFVASSTLSTNFPRVGSSAPLNGIQDAVIFKMNPTLSSLIWSKYFGGAGLDAGYSLDLDTAGNVYLAGGTNSQFLPQTSNGLQAVAPGDVDGFVAKLSAATGITLQTTFLGTNQYDQAFLVKTDRVGDVYVFGQTKGVYPISPNVFSTGNGGQFIQKLNPNLSISLMSTVFGGSGNVQTNITPTAFLIDRCFNILISGWGGLSNNSNMGNTTGLPVTPNAFQSTTDGSDLYFMVLGRNAETLKYASFFGGTAREHVDGGTSRFDPQGIIYQGVCAGCAGLTFPTTPGVFSPTNGSTNCNIAGIKFDLQTEIQAIADVEINVEIDSICGGSLVTFLNNSINANQFFWDFGNGDTSTLIDPSSVYVDTGTYQIMLVAIDTICDQSDTTYFTFTNNTVNEVLADFTVNYLDCDKEANIQITNNSLNGDVYEWDFGDGNTSTDFEPSHAYIAPGLYTIQLIVKDTICDLADTISIEINFTEDVLPPIISLQGKTCANGTLDVETNDNNTAYVYEWTFPDGTSELGQNPEYIFRETGQYTVKLTIRDTVCGYVFDYELDVYVVYEPDRVYIPNAFTPNLDGKNEELFIAGNTCLEEQYFVVLNRWGEVVFETNTPFEVFWNGKYKGDYVKQDIYVYRFSARRVWRTGFITVLF